MKRERAFIATRRNGEYMLRTLLLCVCALSYSVSGCAREHDAAPAANEQDSTAPASAPSPSAPPPADEAVDTHGDAGNMEWTIGDLNVERAVAGVATMLAVRTARHDDYDRLVFDFGADSLPSYALEYVDRPVRQCGSGDPVPLLGDAWLRIEFTPAYAHTEEGQPTISQRSLAPDLPNLKELKLTCDFEAHVEWVAGLASPNRYRVIQLNSPTRLVVDVRHSRR